MDDPARVGGIERVGDLNGDRHDAGNLQRSLLHEVTQRLAFHELHGDERQSVLGLADVVDDADVRMIERRSGLGLGQEPLPAVRIVRQIRRQELDRRLPVEPCVFRQEHFPHPARAEPGGDAVVANRVADHEICAPVVQPVIPELPVPGGFPRRCRARAKNVSTMHGRSSCSRATSMNSSWTRSDASSRARIRGSNRSSTRRRSRSRCWSKSVASAQRSSPRSCLNRIVRVAGRLVQEGPHTLYPRAAQNAGPKRMRLGQPLAPMLDAPVVRQKGLWNPGRRCNSRRSLRPDSGLVAGRHLAPLDRRAAASRRFLQSGPARRSDRPTHPGSNFAARRAILSQSATAENLSSPCIL